MIYIEQFMPLWKMRFTVLSENETVYKNWVYFRRGVFQGGSLSPLLFCISHLLLWFELRGISGYSAATTAVMRKHKITHFLNIDDSELYASNEKNLQKYLPTSFVMGMSFVLDSVQFLTCPEKMIWIPIMIWIQPMIFI